MGAIGDGFEQFARVALPAGTSADNIASARRIFFAGAAHLWEALRLIATRKDAQGMDTITAELKEFGAQCLHEIAAEEAPEGTGGDHGPGGDEKPPPGPLRIAPGNDYAGKALPPGDAREAFALFLAHLASVPADAEYEIGLVYDYQRELWQVYQRVGDKGLSLHASQARKIAQIFDNELRKPKWQACRESWSANAKVLRALAAEVDSKNAAGERPEPPPVQH